MADKLPVQKDGSQESIEIQRVQSDDKVIVHISERPNAVEASSQSLTPKTSRWKRFHDTHVAAGISPTHLFAYLLLVASGIGCLVLINTLQVYVLVALGVQSADLGETSGTLAFYDELVTIFTSPFWGLLSDKIGRRAVYAFGFVFMGIGLVCYPLATSVYGVRNGVTVPGGFITSLVAARLLFALGAASTSSMLTAVLGDYAHPKHRSALSALVGVFSGIGALVAALGVGQLPVALAPQLGAAAALEVSLIAAGIVSVVGGVIFSFMLHDRVHVIVYQVPGTLPDAPSSSNVSQLEVTSIPDAQAVIPNNKSSYFATIKVAWEASRQDAELFLAYLGGLVARADSIVISLFLPILVYQFLLADGTCPPEGRILEPGDKPSCTASVQLSSILTGLANTLALIGAPVFGGLAHLLHRDAVLLSASLLGTVVFALFAAIRSPSSGLSYFASSMGGLAQIGMIVSSLTLVAARAPPSARGAISGLYGLMGGVGILAASKVGGWASDAYGSSAPFIMLAFLHGITTLVSLPVWLIRRQRQQAQQNCP